MKIGALVDAREMDEGAGRVPSGLESRLVNGGGGRSAGQTHCRTHQTDGHAENDPGRTDTGQ